MWHPLRLAEDFATADILTHGRVIFGVGRGYHTREVESLGGPMLDMEANREIFEEQVEIIFKAFNEESFSHQGKYYTLPPKVPYRGYELQELTLVPRPLRRPVECWQPIVSATQRGLDFMVKHRIKGIVGGGSATMAASPIVAYRDAAQRAGLDWQLGENLAIGVSFHLAETREQAIREATPWYEEYVKMFAPLGFVRGLNAEQFRAIDRRGGWAAAGVPTLADAVQAGTWYCGPPEGCIEYLQTLQEKYPGLEVVNASSGMGTPKKIMVEQLEWFGKEVMPAFQPQKVHA
jgi:alkanesulfonate monooxygenase SsuD/methylene tetrahydromethanopterin reductase-like flavin-dependent oxidoreductase (luciferase family)